MKNKNDIQYSLDIEKILHPNLSKIKKITEIIVISVAWLLHGYDDRETKIRIDKESNQKWHLINEEYRTQLGECKTNEKAFWVNYKNPRILILEECSSDRNSSWKTIMIWIL